MTSHKPNIFNKKTHQRSSGLKMQVANCSCPTMSSTAASTESLRIHKYMNLHNAYTYTSTYTYTYMYIYIFTFFVILKQNNMTYDIAISTMQQTNDTSAHPKILKKKHERIQHTLSKTTNQHHLTSYDVG